MEQRNCKDCGKPISPGRLKAVPGTKYCVNCADKHDNTIHDVDNIVAKSSTSARNGFAASD
jgi:RNA polymerase-binding transcription factor DksA